MKPPVIAIIGRPNVGKSSLLNALMGKRISIVQDMPGVTRDQISSYLPIAMGAGQGDRFVEIVDTGGYGFVDPDALTDHIKRQIELAMMRANLCLFIVDAQTGLTSADEEIAGLLRRRGLTTLIVANKADSPAADVILGDFARLGLGTPIGLSALHGRGLDQLLASVRRTIDLSNAPTQMPAPQLLMAIVGKRNAGKSTLVNRIAEIYEGSGDRVIVSQVPGTTRDSVDVRFEKDGKTLVVIDTAGVRKKRHMVTNDIEFYSFHRAQRSVRRADVVVMMLDGVEHISEPDKKLAQYISEQHKPVMIVVNKWDLVLDNAQKQAVQRKTTFESQRLMDEFSQYIDQELPWLDYAPVVFITAQDGRNVQAMIDLAQHLDKQAHLRVGTGQLNQAIKQIFSEHAPSTSVGHRIKVLYATQVESAPPTIVLFVNKPDLVIDSYQRFIVNRFRELLPFAEVPIRLLLRGRGDKRDTPSIAEAGAHGQPAKSRPAGKAAQRRAGKTASRRAGSVATRRPAKAKTGKPRRQGKGQ
ncbi:MAG: ribosome biogenesis GTPase Der [Phycisphaerales bacterium]|nr:ribosome biogenesis GTPase Der [Phycisphaerales bacterium]